MDKKAKNLSHTPYEYSDVIYRYTQLVASGVQSQQDYGTGELYTSLEVHTVTLIEENPGITASEIAEHNYRTKGAISQILNKLEEKGLIRREKDPNNARRTLLYVTVSGLELSRKHKEYDKFYMGWVLNEGISLFGYEAMEKFYAILEHFSSDPYLTRIKQFKDENPIDKIGQ